VGRPKGSLNKSHVALIDKECGHCGIAFTVLPSKAGRKFCSRPCSYEGRTRGWVKRGTEHPLWKDGRASYRDRAIAEYGAVCCECGYDKHVELLQVHHKDFARTDHSLPNLEVLCVRCHLERHVEAGLPFATRVRL
jgi:5-methylcytosine-specific restriction endonuclease McrA